MDKELEDVRTFHNKFNLLDGGKTPRHLTSRKLQERVECMREEIDEFEDAIILQDLAGQADALVDLVYFAKGTAVMLGLPWEELWDDVQRANVSKVRGVTKRGHAVDVTKPEGWLGPRTLDVLKNNGYDPKAYMITYTRTKFDESLCADDSAGLCAGEELC